MLPTAYRPRTGAAGLLGLSLCLLAALVLLVSCDTAPGPPTPGPDQPPATAVRLWFSPTLTNNTIEPGGALRLQADVPDPEPNRKGPRPLPYVFVEMRDAQGQPAPFGPGPGSPMIMYLMGSPPVWTTDSSAPTVPGTYQLRLLIQVAGQPTQTVELAEPLLRVVTPPTPLQSGFVYDRDGNLWLTSTDGTRTRKLTFFPRSERSVEPAWSPDGQRIAYSHTLPGPADQLPVSEIWSVQRDGSDPRPLVVRRTDEDLLYPAWTPDGNLLVTAKRVIDPLTGATPTSERQPDGRESWAIWLVDLPTGARRLLVDDALMPDMSPDGQRLVYVGTTPARSQSEQSSARTLMIATADGSNPRVLVPPERYQDVRTPRFSPDGQQIAFATVNPDGWSPVVRQVIPPVRRPALNGVPWDVYLIPTAGGEAQRLTGLQADLPAAAWTGTNTSLAVLSDRGLYQVALDGTARPLRTPGALHGILSWFGP